MRTLKISPSVLNNFARYLDESLEYETYERLIEKFEKPFEVSEKMAFGTACHKLIEKPSLYDKGENFVIPNDEREAAIIGKEVVMTKGFAQPLTDFHSQHPMIVYEQRHRNTYQIGDYIVIVSMKVDGLEIDTVYDFKISSSAPKVDEYYGSFQWKCYLDAMELPCFKYQVFQHHGRHPNKKLTAHDPVVLYRYDGITQDVEGMIWQFIQFITDAGYIDRFYFEE